MKKIVLNTASVSNSNGFLDAGTEVGVGNGVTQITEDRAKALVAGKLAADVTPKAKPRKAKPKATQAPTASPAPASTASALAGGPAKAD